MAFTPLANALVELFDQMASETVAIQAHVSRALAMSVKQSVKEKVLQYYNQSEATDEVPTAEEVYNIVDTAVRGVHAERLASVEETTADAIWRCLRSILTQTKKLQAKNEARNGRAGSSNISSLLGQTVSESYLEDLEWPSSIPEHASMLRRAHNLVYDKRETYGAHSVIISLKDMEKLLDGATVMNERINRVYKDVITKLPTQRITSSSNVSHAAKIGGGDQANLPGTVEQAAGNKVAAKGGRSKPPPIITSGVPLMARNPHLTVIDHTAQPIIPAKPALAPAPPQPSGEANNKPKPALLPLATRSISMPSIPNIRQTLVPKHTIDRSPGQSPQKKKIKPLRKNAFLPKPPTVIRPKKPINEYMIWAAIERKRLSSAGHDNVLSKHLANIWEHMTAAEKAPFLTLKKADEVRYKSQAVLLRQGGKIDAAVETKYWEDFWNEAREAQRSKALLNAELYKPQLEGQSGEDGQTKGTSAAQGKHTMDRLQVNPMGGQLAIYKQLSKTTGPSKTGGPSNTQPAPNRQPRPDKRKTLARLQGSTLLPPLRAPSVPATNPRIQTTAQASNPPTGLPSSLSKQISSPTTGLPHTLSAQISTPTTNPQAHSLTKQLPPLPPLPPGHPLRRVPAMHFQPPRPASAAAAYKAASRSTPEDPLVRLRKSNDDIRAAVAGLTALKIPNFGAKGQLGVEKAVSAGSGVEMDGYGTAGVKTALGSGERKGSEKDGARKKVDVVDLTDDVEDVPAAARKSKEQMTASVSSSLFQTAVSRSAMPTSMSGLMAQYMPESNAKSSTKAKDSERGTAPQAANPVDPTKSKSAGLQKSTAVVAIKDKEKEKEKASGQGTIDVINTNKPNSGVETAVSKYEGDTTQNEDVKQRGGGDRDKKGKGHYKAVMNDDGGQREKEVEEETEKKSDGQDKDKRVGRATEV